MFSQCWWSPAHQEIWASTRHTLPTSRFFVVLCLLMPVKRKLWL
jgi:hypothetical protein